MWCIEEKMWYIVGTSLFVAPMIWYDPRHCASLPMSLCH